MIPVLRAGATLAVVVGLHVALAPVAFAESRTPAEATQHAYEELQNSIAQGRITRTPTPTPSPTLTLTPTATVAPLVMPADSPTATPLPVATSAPCWLLDDQGDVIFDQDGAPVPCPIEQPTEEVPIATDTPSPTLTPTSTPPIQPQAAVQVVAVVQTVVVIVTATPEPATATALPTVIPTPSPTRTSTAAPTPSATITPTSTPTVLPVHIALVNPDRTDRQKTRSASQIQLPDRTGIVLAVLGALVVCGTLGVFVWRRKRQVYLKQLEQIA